MNIKKLTLCEEINIKYGSMICSEYKKPKVLLEDLSKKYNCSSYIISQVLKMNDVEFKSIQEVNKETNFRGRFNQRTHHLNYDYFNNWSSRMAYLLGFIYADGYVTSESKNRLRLNLQLKDKIILEYFKSELEYGGEIIEYSTTVNGKVHNSCRLDISSFDLLQSLRTFGLHNNKSLDIEFPKVPKEFELDFIRGFFDGDGSIGIKRQIHKTKKSDTYQLMTRFFSGSETFLISINEILESYGLKSKNIRKERSLYNLTYSTKESYLIYNLLYKKDSLCLERKKSKFEEGFRLRDDN